MVKNGIINKRGVLSIRNSRVEFWENLPPSKRPKSKSFLNVQEAVKDSLNLLKLDFFSFIASLVEPYLRAYQTDRPMIPFMCNDLKKLSEPVEVIY